MSASLEDQVDQLHQQADEALQRGDLPAAAALADQAAEQVKAAQGEATTLYANALFVQASLARIQKELPRANQLYEQALAIIEKIPGEDANLANALIVLSQRYTEQGNAERARQLRQQARQVILERLPADENLTMNLAIGLGGAIRAAGEDEEEVLAFDQDLAQAAAQAGLARPAFFYSTRVAGHYANLNRLELAGQAAQQAHDWLARLDAADTASVPGALLELANVELTLGNAGQAAALFQQVAGLLDEKEPSNAEIFVDITFGLAKAYQQQQDFQRAEERILEMLSRTAALYGRDDLHTAQSAERVGDFYLDEEQYTRAPAYYEFALQLREQKLGRDDLLVADVLNALGICSDQTGRFAQAAKYYQRALAIRELHLPRAHPDTVTTLYNLAELARIQGDNDTAEQRFRAALEIPGIPAYLAAQLKNNLGELYTREDRFAEARPLLLEALAARTELFGAQSGKAARSLDSLGSLEFAQGHFAAAGEYSTQARAIYLKENLQRFANSAAINIAKALAFGGDIPAAVPLLEAAVEEARAAYGNLHAQVAAAQTQLAIFYALLGQWQKARETIWAAQPAEDNHLVEILLSASRSRTGAFLADTRKSLHIYLGALLNDPQAGDEDRRRAYEITLRRNGLQTRLLRMLKPGLGVPPWKAERYTAWIAELGELREKLTHVLIYVGAPGAQDARDLQLRITELEKKLAEAGLERTVDTIVYPLPAHAISAALPPQSILVEFIDLPDYTRGFGSHGPTPRRYAAFVVKAAGQMEGNVIADVDALETVFAQQPALNSPAPLLFDLGDAAQIDAGVEELLRAVDFGDDGQGTPRWRRKARFLYNRLIQPLEDELQGAAHVIFAPDGALNSLPFEILADAHGKLLSDRFSTSYLQAGREVIRFWEHFNPGDPSLVIAAPDYDLAVQAGAHADQAEMDERLSALQAGPRFEKLDYTLPEGTAVAAALEVPLHSAGDALETLLKNSHSPEIIHMATHGFYLRRAKPAGSAQDLLEARSALDDPLERSGLVLAGANAFLDMKTPPPRAEDGILFASEIVDLDLSHTDLVCLSACQSGQGDIRLGEGLQGLRSAFSAAGSRSLVSALWQLPDKASQQIIELFYASLLKGAPRAEALRAARQTLQAAYPRDPLFWAGLVLDGSPGPLYRFKPTSSLKVVTVNFRDWGLNPSAKKKPPETPAEIAESYYDQGLALLDEDKAEDALRAFDSAIRLADAPQETVRRARYEKAGALRSMGNLAKAEAEYGRLLEAPGLPEKMRLNALADRGTTYILANQFETAIQDFSEGLASPGIAPDDSAWLLVNRGSAYRMLDRESEALADFSAVLSLEEAPREQRFKALLNRGDIYRQQGENALAVADLSQALDLKEGSPTDIDGVMLSRGLAYYALKDYPHAIQDFSLLLQNQELAPLYQQFCLCFRARCYQESGSSSLAAEDYRRLLTLPDLGDDFRAEARQALGLDP